MKCGMPVVLLAAIAMTLCCLSHCHKIDKALHRERDSDGAFAGRGAGHAMNGVDGQHDTDFDHESILGSSKDAEEYDNLPAEEAKKRLRVLLEKMDTNSDEKIDTKEMQAWILRSFKMLSREESDERFEDADEDGNERVSWAEHLKETYGIDNEQDWQDTSENGQDTTRMMREDRELFTSADKNEDGVLDSTEFLAFSHPEEDEAMVPLLVQHALLEKDKDKDGLISFAEYIQGQQVSSGTTPDEAGLLEEKERFDEDYDTNLDGSLDPMEVQHWLVPDNEETASSETQHLFAAADTDEDGLLSFDEVLGQHEVFVGSEITDYGDHLHNLDRFKDEL